jgi:8-oxo-dGTP pyrophosphatase MutT (NUDIX family)
MNRVATPDDKRLREAQCESLQPVAEVHRNPWFSVCDRGGRFTVEYHQRQVSVLPVVDGESVVMVRPKRPVLDDCPLEFPAGGVEGTETAAAAAARELFEETGIGPIAVDRFVALPPIGTAPNRTPVLGAIFRVDLTRAEFEFRGNPDDEVVAVENFGIDELRQLVASGGIYVTLPLSMLLHFFLSVTE